EDHHAVPRQRRNLHGALPQHGARRQRDADSLGPDARRTLQDDAAADAAADAIRRGVRRSRRDPAHRLRLVGMPDGKGTVVTIMSNSKQSARAIGRGLLAAALCVALAPGGASAQTWHENYFPNVELTTHTGERVHFYDLIKGKTVGIELIYTTCQFACP